MVSKPRALYVFVYLEISNCLHGYYVNEEINESQVVVVVVVVVILSVMPDLTIG